MSSKHVHDTCTSIAFWDVTDILYWKLTSILCLMPSYAFAIGNVWTYLWIGPKTRTNCRFLKTARTKAKKEDVSGETRTYGNPILANRGSNFSMESADVNIGIIGLVQNRRVQLRLQLWLGFGLPCFFNLYVESLDHYWETYQVTIGLCGYA